jgi:uncharacterized protein (TIGR02246 family)
VDTWNNHDAKSFASFFTEDGEWTDVMGQTTIGRKEVERGHVYPFTTVLKDAVFTLKSTRTKWIKGDVASIDIAWESTGHKTPDGQPILTTRRGLLNLITRKEKEEEEEN